MPMTAVQGPLSILKGVYQTLDSFMLRDSCIEVLTNCMQLAQSPSLDL